MLAEARACTRRGWPTPGFAAPELLQIEGPGFLVPDFEARWADEARREAMLQAARWLESEPEMLAASSHLMAIARKPK